MIKAHSRVDSGLNTTMFDRLSTSIRFKTDIPQEGLEENIKDKNEN
jgi:hypothetical protein